MKAKIKSQTVSLILLLMVLVLSVGCGFEEQVLLEKKNDIKWKGKLKLRGVVPNQDKQKKTESGPTWEAPKTCTAWEKKLYCFAGTKEEKKTMTCQDGSTVRCTRTVAFSDGTPTANRCACTYKSITVGEWQCDGTCPETTPTVNDEEGQGSRFR